MSRYTSQIDWEDQNGKLTPISELTDQHIINILNLFDRSDVDEDKYLELMAVYEEAQERGLKLKSKDWYVGIKEDEDVIFGEHYGALDDEFFGD